MEPGPDGPGRRVLVAYADGPDGPLPDPSLVETVLGAPVELLLGWVVRTPPWLETGATPVTSLMLGAGLRRAAASGRVRSVATRLSAIPGLLSGRLRPEVTVVGATGSPGNWRLVGSPGWALDAVRASSGVIIERWPESGPAGAAPPIGPPLPPCNVLGVIDRHEPLDPPPVQRAGEEHRAIGRLVASLVPEGATVQWGPGAVGASVIDALRIPVQVWSGLVTDELAAVAERGLLAAPAVSAYVWGGARLRSMVAAGSLRLEELRHTHDVTAISGIPRFVAVNTALQVGLDGSANVETVEGRIVSGPGGHPDFALGASRSPGGLSIVALTSTSGERSNVVARTEVVSTPRADVDVVVTEHGVADLRGCTDAERGERMVAVADPAHRALLRRSLAGR